MALKFPSNVLGIKVEILLNGVWTDISTYVQQRNNITISGIGRGDWTSQIQAGQMTLTLRNTDGRFTPKNTAGAYYPNIVRNTQIRLYVDALSETNVAYAGYRFWGEVTDWPPKWDPTGRDVYCSITCSGIFRRMNQTKTTLGSPFQRYYSALTGSNIPRGYWSLEDGSGSTDFVSLTSGVSAGTYVGEPSFAGCSDFIGSNAIVTFNGAAITLTVPAGGTHTNNCTRFLLSVPADGDSASGTTNWNLTEVKSSGTVDKFELYLNYTGTLLVQGRNAAGTIIFTTSSATNVKGVPYLVSQELTPSGGNVVWAVKLIKPGDLAVVETLTGSVAGTIDEIQTVKLSRANALKDSSIGHVAVMYAVPSITDAAYALSGYDGEYAIDRFNRLCTEEGLAHEAVGVAANSAPMGPQTDKTIVAQLNEIEDTDCGVLFESRTQFGIGYRSQASMVDQAVACTFDYAAKVLVPPLDPNYDDQMTRNNITVRNYTGYTSQAVLTVGGMSILAPPNGIGEGYEYDKNVNAHDDSQVSGIANWYLNVGAVDEIRIPTFVVDMRRTEVCSLFGTIPALFVGSYIQITNPPSFLRATAIRQLIWGYTEVLNAFEWTITFNTVPETPYETGFTPGTVQLKRMPGGKAVSSAMWQKSLTSLIKNGVITPSMLNDGITIRTLGGIAITVGDPAPANPNEDDIWINSTSGLISQWDGAAWQPYKFDAGLTIQPETIVTANIAAGQITAGLMAAGIIVAGIVDTTVINAGTLLIYSGAPAEGSLVGSFASDSGTDPYGVAYPIGVKAIQGTFTGITIGSAGITGTSITGGSILNVPITNPQITGGTISETSITFDQVGGQLLVYTSTTTSVSITNKATLSWTAPAGSYTQGKVECWGADAGAGGGSAGMGGEGGGGGGYGREDNYPLVPGATYVIQVGEGGTGGTTGYSGGDGEDTIFDQQGVTAYGGLAGDSFIGGEGGPASPNSVGYAGGDGGGDGTQSTGGCGGGGRAGSTGAGGDGAKSASGTGAAGGTAGSGTGGHAGGNGGNSGANGNNGGGGGGAGAASGVTQFSYQYRLSSSATYYGSDATGGNANNKRMNGTMYQGGETAEGGSYNGTMKSLGIVSGSPTTDLAGKTIDSVSIRLENLHSWYGSGLYVVLGYTNRTSCPASWDGTGTTEVKTYWQNHGSKLTKDISNGGLGTALQNGNAKSISIGRNISTGFPAYDLWNYGYFYGAGGDNNRNPLITVNCHSGAAPTKAGNGLDGRIDITYINALVMIAAIAPAAGSDAASNDYAAGYTGDVRAFEPSSSPKNVEAWHDVTPPTGWSGTCRYKKIAESNMGVVNIQCTHAGTSGNITFMTLPTAYRPAVRQSACPAIANNSAPGNSNQRIDVNTSGAVTTYALPASTTAVWCTLYYPID